MQNVSHQDQTGGLCCIIEQRICLRPCKLAIRFLIANDHLHAREVSVLGSIPIKANIDLLSLVLGRRVSFTGSVEPLLATQ
jgi:hypothetical protein